MLHRQKVPPQGVAEETIAIRGMDPSERAGKGVAGHLVHHKENRGVRFRSERGTGHVIPVKEVEVVEINRGFALYGVGLPLRLQHRVGLSDIQAAPGGVRPNRDTPARRNVSDRIGLQPQREAIRDAHARAKPHADCKTNQRGGETQPNETPGILHICPPPGIACVTDYDHTQKLNPVCRDHGA